MEKAIKIRTPRLDAFEEWWQGPTGWARLWEFTLADPRTLTVASCQHLAADIFYAGFAACESRRD